MPLASGAAARGVSLVRGTYDSPDGDDRPARPSRRSRSSRSTRPDDAPRELEPPGEYPYTRGPYRGHVPRPAVDDPPVRGLRLGGGVERALPLPARARPDRALDRVRPADAARATTRTTRARVGEVGRTGVAIDSLADMEILLGGIPLGEVSTSMTINAPASLLLLLYELVAEEQGVPGAALRGTVQNDILKEYIARGNYIFPPRPVDAADDRSVRVLRRAHPELEHDLDLRVPHPRGGLDRGAGARVHARERDRLLRGGGRRRGCRRTTSARGSRSSSTRTTTSSRRSRSSARRAGCGRA